MTAILPFAAWAIVATALGCIAIVRTRPVPQPVKSKIIDARLVRGTWRVE
jgi:hypothetical protein